MSSEVIDGKNLEQYISVKLGPFTHRKLSEKDGQSLDLPNARVATQEMRRRLDEVFHHISDVSFQTIKWDSPALMRRSYEIALQTAPEGTVVDKSEPLDSFLTVNIQNHAAAIKERMKANYDPLSVPRTFLNLMSHYEHSLGVSGQESSIMTLRLLTEYLPLINSVAQGRPQGTSEIDAVRNAFRSIEGLMPSHIAEVQAIQKTMKINANKAQALALRSIPSTKAENDQSSIVLSKSDQQGLVDAIHIQDRPYSPIELKLAARLLTENQYVAGAFIAFQQLLIQHAWEYLQAHPDRLVQNLEPYNPIFVPVKDADGSITSFAPNPKLLKTMSNNWLPAIAREVITGNPNTPIDKFNPHDITAGHISNGVEATKDLYIFTSLLGEFIATEDPQKIALRGSFSQVCPAKNVFIENGKQVLPDVYIYLKRRSGAKE